MNWQASPDQAADEHAIRRLALLYARAIDRNEPEIIDAIYAEDAVQQRPGKMHTGRAQIRLIPGWVKGLYLRTLHKVHNHLITVSGDTAEGEVYCTAEHLERDRGGGTTLYSMSIRYQDRMVKQQGQWRFQHRQLIIEWTDVRQVVAQNVAAT